MGTLLIQPSASNERYPWQTTCFLKGTIHRDKLDVWIMRRDELLSRKELETRWTDSQRYTRVSDGYLATQQSMDDARLTKEMGPLCKPATNNARFSLSLEEQGEKMGAG